MACAGCVQFRTSAPVPFRLQPEGLRIQHEMCADSLVEHVPADRGRASRAESSRKSYRSTASDIEYPTVRINSDLYDLPIGQFEGVGGMQHDMFIVIAFRDIDGLTVIHPDAQYAVVSGPLEALVDQAAEILFWFQPECNRGKNRGRALRSRALLMPSDRSSARRFWLDWRVSNPNGTFDWPPRIRHSLSVVRKISA